LAIEEAILMRWHLRILAVAVPVLLFLLGWGLDRESAVATAEEAPPAWTTAVTPKPLGAPVKKGLAWLVEHQLSSGGWGQGEESAQMRGGEAFHDKADVADTCIAALALVRSGSTPREGPYKDAVARAVGFVRAQVESAAANSLSVTNIQGTRVQTKLGPNIDTFLASLLLAEVKGRMPDDPGNTVVDVALNKVLDKIKKHQKADGTWDNQHGWAPILAEAIGGKGLNRAKQNGAFVPDALLANTKRNAQAQFARSAATTPPAPASVDSTPIDVGSSGSVAFRSSSGSSRSRLIGGGLAEPGAAGVELYARAANIAVQQDSVNTSLAREYTLSKKIESATNESERKLARDELAQIRDDKRVNQEAQAALLGRLDDAQFVAGFGSNGGEEFLSYMNISESLVVKGGLEWKRWDDAMTGNLGRIQNSDGSWSGHHCITGRTFCTSTALLVLMADRSPVPVKTEAKPK
jgi:Prenyltransferase and squalene oxidase repeat